MTCSITITHICEDCSSTTIIIIIIISYRMSAAFPIDYQQRQLKAACINRYTFNQVFCLSFWWKSYASFTNKVYQCGVDVYKTQNQSLIDLYLYKLNNEFNLSLKSTLLMRYCNTNVLSCIISLWFQLNIRQTFSLKKKKKFVSCHLFHSLLNIISANSNLGLRGRDAGHLILGKDREI